MTKHYFIVTGTIDVDARLKHERAFDGEIVGFRLPDGRTVRPMLALEVESADGNEHEIVTSMGDLESLGFLGLDYESVAFDVVDEEGEGAE